MKRNKFDMLAGKAELFLENYNKSLKYYSLYDDIRLQERLKLKDGTEIVRKAFADKIEGYNHERKLVLTGSPRVIQGSDVIKGYKVTLRENLEMVEVDDSASSFTIKKKQK
jgi:lipopolysaccharide export system protein LptA